MCQLHMRHFKDGEELYLEPWRAQGISRDEGSGRGSQRVRPDHRGGRLHFGVPTGSAPDGNAIPVPKEDADRAMDAAACIGCGACVAACPNAVGGAVHGAKISHLGCCRRASRSARARAGDGGADDRGKFGSCTNIGECEAVCPKEIRLEVIARMNGDYGGAAGNRAKSRIRIRASLRAGVYGSKLKIDPVR